jgi:hypothetical protein
MQTINIYVGKTKENLVLKYPVGLDAKNICHYYDLNEDPSTTAYFLKLELGKKAVVFKQLIDKNKDHGIKPIGKSQLEKLASAYKEAKI